jgi:hypothetical protein
MSCPNDPTAAEALWHKRWRESRLVTLAAGAFGLIVAAGIWANPMAARSTPNWVFWTGTAFGFLVFVVLPSVFSIRAMRCAMCGGGIKASFKENACTKCGHTFPAPKWSR